MKVFVTKAALVATLMAGALPSTLADGGGDYHYDDDYEYDRDDGEAIRKSQDDWIALTPGYNDGAGGYLNELYHHINEDVNQDADDGNFYNLYYDEAASENTALVADDRRHTDDGGNYYADRRIDTVQLTHNGSRLLTVDEILQHLDELEQSLERQDTGTSNENADEEGNDDGFSRQIEPLLFSIISLTVLSLGVTLAVLSPLWLDQALGAYNGVLTEFSGRKIKELMEDPKLNVDTIEAAMNLGQFLLMQPGAREKANHFLNNYLASLNNSLQDIRKRCPEDPMACLNDVMTKGRHGFNDVMTMLEQTSGKEKDFDSQVEKPNEGKN